MPGIFGYFDPDLLLESDPLPAMMRTLGGQVDQARMMKKVNHAGIGIVNYRHGDGIVAGTVGQYAVLGDLEALSGAALSHAAIAQQCFGLGAVPQRLEDIRGGFVAALMDADGRELTLVSDRFASYPLYVAKCRGAWFFASQIKAILAVLPESAHLDEVSVATMLSIGEVVGNRTLISGVETLPAATVMTLSESGISRRKYWQYVYEADPASRWNDAVASVGSALQQSVVRAIGQSESVAVPLSGGLDSRFILDLACRDGMAPSAYTWGTPGCRDIEYACDVARRLHCRHEVFNFEVDYLSRLGERGVWLTEGQTPATNFHVLPYVDVLATRGHDTILDGFAGDGLLGGNFIAPTWFDNPDFSAAADAIWNWRRGGFDGRWETSALDEVHALAGDAFKNLYLTYPGHSSMDKAMAFLTDNRVRRITTCGTELFRSRMLVKQPFMDADVIEAMRTVPHIWRKRHHFYLAVLKRFAPQSSKAPYQRTMLPASAPYAFNLASMAFQRGYGLLEKRMGCTALFKGKSPSDFSSWFRNELRTFVEEMLLSERALSRGVVHPDVARQVVALHMEGVREHSSLIGAMLSIEIFCRLFLDDFAESQRRMNAPTG